MSDIRWIALHCGEDTKCLISRHPNAFLLLTLIGIRAKWKDCPIENLRTGQAYIGDWKAAGMKSEKAYRHAKETLAKCQLATFQGSNKGTIATLANRSIYSVSVEVTGEPVGDERAVAGRALGDRRATNHTDTQKTLIPSSVCVDSAPAGGGEYPPPAGAVYLVSTVEQTLEYARIIRDEEIKRDPYCNFAIIAIAKIEGIAMGWCKKCERDSDKSDYIPVKNPKEALRGYLKAALKRIVKKFKELPPDPDNESFA